MIARPDHGLTAGLHADLAVESAEVIAHGLFPEAELPRKAGVVPSLTKQLEQLALTFAELRTVGCVRRRIREARDNAAAEPAAAVSHTPYRLDKYGWGFILKDISGNTG